VTLQQWLQAAALGDEIFIEAEADVAGLKSGAGATANLTPSPFGHKYDLALAFTPVGGSIVPASTSEPSTLQTILADATIVEEATLEVPTVITELQVGAPASFSVPISLYGHAYTFSAGFTPVAATASA
jgi:hypothetical protein